MNLGVLYYVRDKCASFAQNTPRPMGLHATKPNEVIHFDYLYMSPSKEDAEYVLIVKNDYSNMFGSQQCKNDDAESTVSVLIEWSATFGVAPQWVFDQQPPQKPSDVGGAEKARY
jgi:hypothetical protein